MTKQPKTSKKERQSLRDLQDSLAAEKTKEIKAKLTPIQEKIVGMFSVVADALRELPEQSVAEAIQNLLIYIDEMMKPIIAVAVDRNAPFTFMGAQIHKASDGTHRFMTWDEIEEMKDLQQGWDRSGCSEGY